MGSRSNHDLHSRSRNKNDLIDLSNEIDNRRGNDFLDLFDPLTHSQETTNGFKETENDHSPPQVPQEQPTIRLRRPLSKSHKSSTESCKVKESSNKTDQCSSSDQSVASQNSSSSGISIPEQTIGTTTPTKINKLSDRGNSLQTRVKGLTNRELCGSLKVEKFEENNILKLSRKHQRSSQELASLTNKIKSFRSQYKNHDLITNPGIISSPTLYGFKNQDMSVKIIIVSPLASAPLNFTCNVSTTIEHLISHAVCSIIEDLSEGDNMDKFMLKVTGKEEYFKPELRLADYAIVSNCCKFDQDVHLTLIRTDSLRRPYLRTPQDDFRVKSLLCPDDLLSRAAVLKFSDLNYESLRITIDTFDREAKRLYHDVANKSTSIQPQSLLQCTKAICSLMMSCETGPLSESKDNLAELCKTYRAGGSLLKDEDRYMMIEVIRHAINRLMLNMHRLLRLTSNCLPVDYEIKPMRVDMLSKNAFVDTTVDLIKEQVALKIHLVSQLRPDWISKYHQFHIAISLKHGDSNIGPTICTSKVKPETSFFPRLLFDEDIIIPVTYSVLPREVRVLTTLIGSAELVNQQSSNGSACDLSESDEPSQLNRTSSATSIESTAPMYKQSSSLPKESHIQATMSNSNDVVTQNLAASMTYLFDHDLNLVQGDKLTYMHSMEDGLDIYIETVVDREDPIMLIEFKQFPPEKKIHFPHDISTDNESLDDDLARDFEKLDPGVKYVLKPIIYEKQSYEKLMEDEKELLWENRKQLVSIPEALPKVILSAPDWSSSSLAHIYHLIDVWAKLKAVDAIQLMLPSFPDNYVRQKAIDWISEQHDDELYDYLPQLLQAFKYEKCVDCPLFWLLMERSLKNLRLAALMYWQLKLLSRDKLLQERGEILISCLQYICGAAFWKSMDNQEELLAQLTRVSSEVKKCRDSSRMRILLEKLEKVHDYLVERKPTMPWAPSLEICDLDMRCCSYFPSNTVPLKLAFRSCERSCNQVVKFYTYDTIFKVGDDLRQDMLAMQMIRIMEKLWLREGLDLRMVTFDCLATNDRQGMVEVVKNAETLRKIQQNSGYLAGSFNPKAIDSYIRLWNTSELEYHTALDKFLHSCAGYTIATYILGICDRHNDNIMITNSGHLFHIDFGKFLGDAQMMGSIKRDRTPFVLTTDMAYVINGGDRPTKKFQSFIELCAMGFNIIRRHRNLFLNLFSLMSSANINGLNSESVKYVDKMMMPNITETEAMAKFTRLIEECLSSKSTQINFFIHNLAQLRFTSDSTTRQTLLSFVPKTFTIQTDGKIESLKLVQLYKKYEPEKQYYYVVRVKRENQPDSTDITRTFREFSELQLKLNCMFPRNNFNKCINSKRSTGSFLMDFVGRNNTKEVAQRRYIELEAFLRELLRAPPEISQCDLIYTFFHPILRDQVTNSVDLNASTSFDASFGHHEYTEQQRRALYLGSNGQVKLSLSYKNSSFIIMIMHAKNLVFPEGSTPNCYAKTYLLPDPQKQTKKKTRIVRQSCHPSFMELIVYKISPEVLRRRTLQVSIWHSEIAQYKDFMGAALIPLDKLDFTKEIVDWYPLKPF